MRVDEDRAAATAEHAGQRFYFCCAGCCDRFVAEPAAFLEPKPTPAAPHGAACHGHGHATQAAPAQPAPAGTIYTCPMHPDVRQDHPGNCPICGMGLEPLLPVAGEADNAELKDMTRRLWVSAPLAALVVIIAMGKMLPGVSDALAGLAAPRTLVWIEGLLTTPVVLWPGPFSSPAPGARWSRAT